MPSTLNALRFKQLDPRAVLPKRGSALAAGLDVCAIEDLKIGPKTTGDGEDGVGGGDTAGVLWAGCAAIGTGGEEWVGCAGGRDRFGLSR